MGAQDPKDAGPILIDRRFHVLTEAPCGLFAGLPAFAVDQQAGEGGARGAQRQVSPLIAVRVRRDAPPPANLGLFLNAFNTALLMPVAHGAGGQHYWIVCDAPPGPSLLEAEATGGGGPVSEAELAASYLRPLSLALARLHGLGLTHRAISPANLFRSPESGRVLLAPGCLSPPAFFQPALFEPPGTALCAPEARGPGLPADDVYALGVVLLKLLLGRPLLRGLDDEQIIQRKLEMGSFQALAGSERLPPILVSLLRAMLSDDPQGRPEMAALAEHGIGAERPKAPRPEARAPRPLMVGRTPVSTARMLALSFARQPAEAQALLRAGVVEQWLRRGLELPLLAARIAETLVPSTERLGDGAEQMTLMQTIALLDPLAPMFWNGTWLWPDAVPAMLAAQLCADSTDDRVMALIRHGALRRWMLLTGRSGMQVVEDVERNSARAARLPMPALRGPMLAYSLNPFLPCASPALGGACVLQAEQLVPALENTLGTRTPDHRRLLDHQMLAMLAARSDPDEATGIDVPADADERLLDLRILSQVQAAQRRRSGTKEAKLSRNGKDLPPGLALPRLAANLLPAARDRLTGWPGKQRRLRRLEQLEKAATEGDLIEMLELSCRADAWTADQQALDAVREDAERLRDAHRASLASLADRAWRARAAGGDVAVVGGLVAMVGAVALVLLS